MKKKKTTLSKKQWILIGGFLFLIFFFSINQDLISILLDGDVDKAKTFLDKNIAYALFFMALVMVIQNSFTVFPLILVITINIALFGFVNGFLWSWFTSVLASIIVFYGVRYIFQSMIIHKFDAKIIEKVDANGFAYVFQARLFPFVPTSLVNILAGLSTIRILPFTIATTFGNFIYFFILALIPAGILSSDLDEYLILSIIFVTIALYYVIKLIKHKRKPVSDSENVK